MVGIAGGKAPEGVLCSCVGRVCSRRVAAVCDAARTGWSAFTWRHVMQQVIQLQRTRRIHVIGLRCRSGRNIAGVSRGARRVRHSLAVLGMNLWPGNPKQAGKKQNSQPHRNPLRKPRKTTLPVCQSIRQNPSSPKCSDVVPCAFACYTFIVRWEAQSAQPSCNRYRNLRCSRCANRVPPRVICVCWPGAHLGFRSGKGNSASFTGGLRRLSSL